jgi:hypothetical protein
MQIAAIPHLASTLQVEALLESPLVYREEMNLHVYLCICMFFLRCG